MKKSNYVEEEVVSAVNEWWRMDLVPNQLYNGKRFRLLTVLNTFSRESLAIYAGKSIEVSGAAICWNK